MVQIEPITFGLIIAYLLPGSAAVYGLRYLSPRIDALWNLLERGQIVIGPLILLGLAALAVGLIVSSLRVVVLEPIFYWTGVKPGKLKYDKITNPENRELFKEMVANVYRYGQFYGNMLLALSFTCFIRYILGKASLYQSRSDILTFVLIACSLVTLFFAGRGSLADMNRAIRELCE